MKTKWEGHFFETKLRIQFDEIFDFESNAGIFDSLALIDRELWRFENLKFEKNFYENRPKQNCF